MAHPLVKIKRLQITSVLVVLEALFLTSRIYENLKGLWERHTHRVRDIQVTFSEDYGPSINHSDTEFNGLHPLLATFLSDTLIKYRTEKNNKMYPWFWKEEHVSYLKMSSCLMAPSSWHPGPGWSLSTVCSRSCVPFLPGGISSFQCMLSVQVFAYCFYLSVDGALHVGRGHILNTQHWVCHSVKSCWIKQWLQDPVPTACVCVYMLCVYAHGVGSGDLEVSTCKWSEKPYLMILAP